MLKQKIILRKDSIVTAYPFYVTLKHSKRNSKRNKLREKNKKRAFLKREKNPEKEKKKELIQIQMPRIMLGIMS